MEFRADVTWRYTEAKDTQSALLELYDRYRSLSPTERDEISELLVEGLTSADESLRYDSLALVDEFRITDALPALRQLAERLTRDSAPGAPFELALVKRIIDRLSSTQ